MTRPRRLAICVFRNRSSILVGRGYDAVEDEHFFRPLGGEIEEGESPEEAIRREIREELRVEVTDLVRLGELDNVFRYEGRPGHERITVFDGVLVHEELYERPALPLWEPGWGGSARWLDLNRPFSEPLYPTGLAQLLSKE